MGEGGINAMRRQLYPQKSTGTYCTRAWVGSRAGLDRGREEKISCRSRISNPEASSP